MEKKKSTFTEEQESAIESVGNIIVSAGAGSGKTTVLTERVRRNVLGLTPNGKVNLDELLILTFTNDAATSMKNKIKNALTKDQNLAHLVPYVDSAHIETFDAYSQFIVKKYGHLIGVNKNINVLDSDILYVKISNTISDFLDKQYLKNDPVFEEIIYKYCLKSDNKLLGFLLDIYNQILDKKDYSIDFLNEYKGTILTEEYFKNLIKKADEVIIDTISDLKEAFSNVAFTKINEFVAENLSSILNVSNLEELCAINEELLGISSVKQKFKDLLKEMEIDLNPELEKRTIDRIVKDYSRLYSLSCFHINFYDEDIKCQIKYLTYLIDNVLIKAIEEVEKFKHDTGYYTFVDIAKLAIRILEEREEVRNELKYKYKLIMIDETQDTSESQEKFINLIANNNVFSVGDIKQSIYRFRNARPELFKRKYDAYSNHEDGEAINMNKNFRSRKEVLNTINDIFSVLMTDDFGGANYIKDHIIIPSNTKYDNEGKSDLKHGIFQIPYSSIYFDEDGNLQTNKESRIKGEAATICDNIINRINNGYLVFDNELNGLRPCTYKDFTILTYKGVNFKYFEEVFKQKNIPLNAIYTDDLKADTSIVVLINIFSMISLLSKDNLTIEEESNVKHQFISILRSFLFEYTDEDLYKLFNKNDDSYKQNEIYLKILGLAKNYAKSSLNLLFDKVIKEFNYVEAFSKISDAINTVDKNNIFYNKTKTMDELGYSIDDFVLYLKSLNKFNISMDQVIYTEASNAVTITTIHKSKGLEYPVVYLPNLFDFSAPKFKNNGDYCVLNGQYFFLPFFSDAHKKTNLIGLLLESDESTLKEDKEERLRLFYVALTRAKEDLVFIVSGEPIEGEEENRAKYLERVKKKYEKRKVSISESEIKSIADKEFDDYLKTRDGVSFEDFLFGAFLAYEFDPFMDQSIISINSLVDKLAGEDADPIEQDSIRKEIYKYYVNNHHSLENMSIDEILVNVNNSPSQSEQAKVEVLYEGAIRIFDEILRKIIVYIHSNHFNDLAFEFYAYKKIFVPNLTSGFVQNLVSSINNKDVSLLKELLAKYFVSNYEELVDFEKIKASGEMKLKTLSFEKQEKPTFKKASKDVDDESDESTLDFGTHMHSLLESISLTSPDYSFIENQREKQMVSGVINLLNKLSIEKAKIFKEYQFVNDTNQTRGIIDLLLVYEDKAIVVDYKLKNISDKEYKEQLNVYKEFVKGTFKLSTECYLLSIVDQKLEKIL